MNKPTFGTFRGWKFGTFRGWGKYENSWFDGALIHGWGRGRIAAFIMGYEINESELPSYDDYSEVYPESLAMFTGIHDKNNKPIYASIPLPDETMSKGGDIIRVLPREWPSQTDGCSLTLDEYIDQNYGYNQYVVFHSGASYGRSLSLNERDGQYDYYDIARIDGMPEYGSVQIIGNAFQNPELLEVNKNE